MVISIIFAKVQLFQKTSKFHLYCPTSCTHLIENPVPLPLKVTALMLLVKFKYILVEIIQRIENSKIYEFKIKKITVY